jgi:hypothetical protein
MANQEPEKTEAEEILEIINDPEFDEWVEAGLINPTDPALPTVSPHDTDADLPAVHP